MDNIKKVGIFIMLFVTLLIGMSLFGTLSDSVYDATNLHESVNETIAISLSTGQLAQDDVSAITNFNNITDDFTVNIGTAVNVTKAGLVTIDNTTILTNFSTTYNVTYNFESDEYVAHSTSRVLVRLINIFFALAIMAAAVFAMYAMGITELFKGNK